MRDIKCKYPISEGLGLKIYGTVGDPRKGMAENTREGEMVMQ